MVRDTLLGGALTSDCVTHFYSKLPVCIQESKTSNVVRLNRISFLTSILPFLNGLAFRRRRLDLGFEDHRVDSVAQLWRQIEEGLGLRRAVADLHFGGSLSGIAIDSQFLAAKIKKSARFHPLRLAIAMRGMD